MRGTVKLVMPQLGELRFGDFVVYRDRLMTVQGIMGTSISCAKYDRDSNVTYVLAPAIIKIYVVEEETVETQFRVNKEDIPALHNQNGVDTIVEFDLSMKGPNDILQAKLIIKPILYTETEVYDLICDVMNICAGLKLSQLNDTEGPTVEESLKDYWNANKKTIYSEAY